MIIRTGNETYRPGEDEDRDLSMAPHVFRYMAVEMPSRKQIMDDDAE